MAWASALEHGCYGGAGLDNMSCPDKYFQRWVFGRAPSYKEFVQNMNEKMQDDEFLTDVEPLLRHEVAFNPQEAYQFLYNKVIEKMIVPAT